MKLVIKELIIL